MSDVEGAEHLFLVGPTVSSHDALQPRPRPALVSSYYVQFKKHK